MNWFSYGYHGQQYCSWVHTHVDEVAQIGSHTPATLVLETVLKHFFFGVFACNCGVNITFT